MKNSKVTGLLRGLSAILASLFVLSLCLSVMAQANSSVINRELGLTNFVIEQGEDAGQDTTFYKSEFSTIDELEAAKHELAVSIAAEGSVLPKNNDGALPLNKDSEKVTVWGLNSLFPTLGGLMGSSVAATTDAGQATVSLLDALGMKGVQVNGGFAGFYDGNFDSVRKSSLFGAGNMIQLAKEHSNGKVIVVLNTVAVMEVEELKQDPDIDAILWAGLPGMYGFEGVADVLVGNQSPSGRMVDTYAVSAKSAPAMVNFGINTFANCSTAAGSPLTANDLGDWYLVESEGIYIGYKYYETRYEDSVLGQGNATDGAGSIDGTAWNYANEVPYPFGYGMSYTTFEQKLKDVNVVVGGTSTATVQVTNTGSVPGKEVVELYVQAPYTAGGLEKAAIQLVNFGKTEVLQPGESVELTIEFSAQDFASYDENLVKADGTAGAWVLEAGDYYFAVGNGAHNAINNVLAKKLGSTEGLVSVNADEVIDPENAIAVALDADSETYSVGVQNALQDADLNKLVEGAVEYTIRADWTKGWTPVTDLTATDEMLVGLQNRTYQLSANDDYEITWGADNGLTLANMMKFDEQGNYQGALDYDDPQWDALMQQVTLPEAIQFLENCTDEFDAILSIGIGNVYNNDGPLGLVNDQVSGYAAKWDASMSAEPNYVGPNDKYATWTIAEMPTEPVVAATFNQELIHREGELIGDDGIWANVSGIQGPGVNLHTVAYCGRWHEYYSEDAMLSNKMATAFISGTWTKGTWSVLKHFAINDIESNRVGLATFFTEQSARENGLRAFQGPVTCGAKTGVMTAYNRIGTVFSGGHRGLVTQILRNEWGHDGWTMTDYAAAGFDYMNWLDNIYAGGGGCLCTSANFSDSAHGSMGDERNLALVQSDTRFQHEMQEALKHFLYTFASSNAMNGLSPSSKIVRVTTWWEKALMGAEIGLGVLAALCLIGCAVLSLKSKKSAK